MLKYLGVMTSAEGSMDEEVELRVDTAINEMIREASRNVLEKSDFSRKKLEGACNCTKVPPLLYVWLES